MSESFAELFEQSLNDINMEPGAIVAAQVVDIDGDWVTVNAGLKSEGQIPAAQFRDENGELTIAIGDDACLLLACKAMYTSSDGNIGASPYPSNLRPVRSPDITHPARHRQDQGRDHNSLG